MFLLSGCALVNEFQRQDEARQSLSRAVELFSRADYKGSFRQNQRALELAQGRPPGDEALLALGMLYAHAGNPDRDYGKATDAFKRLIRDFPRSPVTGQARVWLGLIEENGRLLQSQEKTARENEHLSQENQKLKQVIEKSKQVDIEIEQKKRERER